MKKINLFLIVIIVSFYHCYPYNNLNMKNTEIIKYATSIKQFPTVIDKINSLLINIDNHTYQNDKIKLKKSGKFKQRYDRVFGTPKIYFNQKDAKNTLIETKRLYLIPVNTSFVDLYYRFIFGDKEVMKTFGYGKVKDYDYTKSRCKVYEERWSKNYPFSAFAIINKHSLEFYGHIVAGGADSWEMSKNHIGSELAYILKKDKNIRKKGFCIEATGAIIYFLKLLKIKNINLKNQITLDRIVTTNRIYNIASIKVVEKLGFERYIPSKLKPISYKSNKQIYRLNLKDDSLRIRNDIEFIKDIGYVSQKWNDDKQNKKIYRYHYQFYL